MYSITELAKEFDMTTRTIRYYEELGMLNPQRTASGQRVFSKVDRSKMKLILRGKRLGFSLKDIKEMVMLFDTDSTGQQQLKTTLIFGEKKLQEIDDQVANLLLLKKEIEEFQRQFTEQLNNRG
ncbi:MerR family transcriptional regulator [Kurthia sibirica]|uniref:MerR family transcriptional regulator n=1 Tax=Kurthia sibirica TaxID=202750 RepID=A0A2U3APZ9_9BACL|nr:MerR family DNA-binding transcriptional regulator [Kurthia sibirica]PWI26535.1 MerR family transcriptional regulator [Kurthia sibirica]GEK32780.1 MerR family transcriptional regulator [Kurthia sibirica]